MAKPKQKIIEIVAGPNGSGKTTFAEALFKLRNGQSRFINPDIIAAGLSSPSSERAFFHAGRVMIQAVSATIAQGESFAFESTLSGKTWLPIIKEAKGNGYKIIVYFLFLKKVNLNLQRIQKRVKQGGHFIPDNTVKRRYPRSFANFWGNYRDLCDNWFIFDNSGSTPKEVHSKVSFESISQKEQGQFEKLFLKIGDAR